MDQSQTIPWNTFVQVELTDEIFIGLQLYRSSQQFTLKQIRLSGDSVIVKLSHCGCPTECGTFTVKSHFNCNDVLHLRLQHAASFFEFPEARPETILRLSACHSLVVVSWHELKKLMETRPGCIYPSANKTGKEKFQAIQNHINNRKALSPGCSHCTISDDGNTLLNFSQTPDSLPTSPNSDETSW